MSGSWDWAWAWGLGQRVGPYVGVDVAVAVAEADAVSVVVTVGDEVLLRVGVAVPVRVAEAVGLYVGICPKGGRGDTVRRCGGTSGRTTPLEFLQQVRCLPTVAAARIR